LGLFCFLNTLNNNSRNHKTDSRCRCYFLSELHIFTNAVIAVRHRCASVAQPELNQSSGILALLRSHIVRHCVDYPERLARHRTGNGGIGFTLNRKAM
jgi:hypothetical protein